MAAMEKQHSRCKHVGDEDERAAMLSHRRRVHDSKHRAEGGGDSPAPFNPTFRLHKLATSIDMSLACPHRGHPRAGTGAPRSAALCCAVRGSNSLLHVLHPPRLDRITQVLLAIIRHVQYSDIHHHSLLGPIRSHHCFVSTYKYTTASSFSPNSDGNMLEEMVKLIPGRAVLKFPALGPLIVYGISFSLQFLR